MLATFLMLYLFYAAGRAILTWVVADAHWEVIAANLPTAHDRTVYPEPRDLGWWISPWPDGLFYGDLLGIWIRQRLGAILLVVGMPIFLAFLPFAPPVRVAWVTIGLLTLGGFFLGRAIRSGCIVWRRRVGWLSCRLVVASVRGEGRARFPSDYQFMGRPTAHADHCRYRDCGSFPIGEPPAICWRSGYPIIRAFCVAISS